MLAARHNEKPQLRFRTERVYNEGDDKWLIHTREGVDVGPYPTRFDAEVEAALLQAILAQTTQGPDSLRAVRDFVEDGTMLQMERMSVEL